MTLTEFADIEQRSDEWFDQRRGIVTASTVGQLVSERTLTGIDFDCPGCGAHAGLPCRGKRGDNPAPIKTIHSERIVEAQARNVRVVEPVNNPESRALIATLASERITGWTENTFTNWDMQRGIDDEPRARDFYAEHHAPVRESGFMRKDEPGWSLGFSPDGLVGDDGFIEVKSRVPKKQVTTVLAGCVPPEHVAQVQAGLFVTERAWCDYISWAGGMEFWVVRVLPDPDWQTAIRDALVAAEKAITQMVNDYRAAVDGLPVTERNIELEMVI